MEVTIIIRKSKGFVKHGENVVKRRNFIPKWGMNDHKTCHVKLSLLQKGSFKLMVVISDIRRSTIIAITKYVKTLFLLLLSLIEFSVKMK